MEPNQGDMEVVLEIVAVLNRLEIPYALAGSWASVVQGKGQLDCSADAFVESFAGKETAFRNSFGADYYLRLPDVEDAIHHRSSFNLIHLPIGFRMNLFVRKDRPFDVSMMARRQVIPLSDNLGQSLTFVSPEDLVLLQGEWYRLGGESSERQWNDILGVFQIQADKLDQAYLDRWAADLGVGDLLQRARQESGV